MQAWLIALIAVIVVVVVAGAAYFAISSLPKVPSTGKVSALLELLSAKQLNASAVEQYISSSINASPTFNVSYSGSATLYNPATGQSENIPFTLTYLKYLNDSRVDVMLMSAPTIGNASIVGISINKAQVEYSCLNSTLTSGWQCYNVTSAPSSSALSELNVSRVANSTNSDIKVTSVGSGSVNGLPCILVYANGTVTSTAPTLGGSSSASVVTDVHLVSCFSTAYSVPLNLTVTATNPSVTATVVATETGIGGPVTQGEVTTLPGPVV